MLLTDNQMMRTYSMGADRYWVECWKIQPGKYRACVWGKNLKKNQNSGEVTCDCSSAKTLVDREVNRCDLQDDLQ